jgi:subtilisin family serine protease
MVQADKITSSNAADKKVCIIDSGYSDQHADLRDYTGTDLTAKLTDSGSGTWNQDSCGHGSHVAGTIAAIGGNGTGVVGANPGVALHIVKVFGDNALENGSCGWTYSSTLVSALNSCKAAGANVVSMSLGGPLKSRTEEQAFNDANKAGILSIAAAGNAGNNTTSYPAGYAAVMSVAAVDANEVKGSFSQSNKDVEIAAPGVAVLSTTPWLDLNTLSAGDATWTGGRLDGAPRTTAVGNLVDGGLCTSAGTWAGKVVLCQRGSNSFANKVANVQAGGGSAAVVYNSAASDPTCGVFAGTLGTPATTTIAAIALSCADGAAAVAAAGTGLSGFVQSVFSVPNSGYEAWDGTSMATPHVSAVAALIWSCHPTKTNQQIRSALTNTALDKGAPGRDNSYGFGIVRAKYALLSGLGGPGSCVVQ